MTWNISSKVCIPGIFGLAILLLSSNSIGLSTLANIEEDWTLNTNSDVKSRWNLLSFDNNDNLFAYHYLLYSYGHIINKYSPSGELLCSNFFESRGRDGYYGMDTDSSGNVYLGSYTYPGGNLLLRKFDSNCNIIWSKEWYTEESGWFGYISDVEVNSDGTIYAIAIDGNSSPAWFISLSKLDKDGNIISTYKSNALPSYQTWINFDLSFDAIYLVNDWEGTIYKFDKNLNLVWKTNLGSAIRNFDVIYNDGFIYVTSVNAQNPDGSCCIEWYYFSLFKLNENGDIIAIYNDTTDFTLYDEYGMRLGKDEQTNMIYAIGFGYGYPDIVKFYAFDSDLTLLWNNTDNAQADDQSLRPFIAGGRNAFAVIYTSPDYTHSVIKKYGLVVSDSDGDGIPDDEDRCPNQDSTGFDADNNGCIDSISDLIQIIEILPDDALLNETKNSLISKVENAQKSTDKDADNAAINQLNSFINEVNAQREKKVSEEVANMLITYALNIIAQIEAG